MVIDVRVLCCRFAITMLRNRRAFIRQPHLVVGLDKAQEKKSRPHSKLLEAFQSGFPERRCLNKDWQNQLRVLMYPAL